MDFEWSLFASSMPSLLRGAETTLMLSAASLVLGLVIGIIGAVLRATAIPVLVWGVTAWTTLIRGLPLLVTLLFLYYGLPSLGILLSSVTVAIVALAITTGAFVTEIVRAGIESIDRGQMRAAKSLGMSWAVGMRYVVLPQALRRVLPPLTNEAITLVKSTALVSVIAIPGPVARGHRRDDLEGQHVQPVRRGGAGVSLHHPAAGGAQRVAGKAFRAEPSRMRFFLRGATVLPGATDWAARTHTDLLIEDGIVAAMGTDLAAPEDAIEIRTESLVVMPAFDNAHTHAPEMLGRGVLPMASQPEWLTRAYADGRDALSDADITRAIRLCATETVRGGAVSVTDHFRQVPVRAAAVRVAARAWADTGLRARLAVNMRDRTAEGGGLIGVPGAVPPMPTGALLAMMEDLLREGAAVPLGIGPSAPHRVTDDLLVGAAALARAHGAFLHMHLCESIEDAAACRALYRVSAVAHLDRLGVLGPGVELVHAVHVDDDDLALIARRGATVVHSPVANLRLGAGVAPIARALRHGVRLRMGCDGAGSNDSQSMLETVKGALLAPRAIWGAAEWLSPVQVLDIATAGARLAPGAPADIVAFDATAPAFTAPVTDWSARIVLAARETDIVHVIGAGRFLMRERTPCLP